ncbi:MAG: hypothetical protein QOF56_4230 [Acidobacteriaceae bacterium]|nr:hypothetical protein [Acidobacteriaceae bacterium]
MGYPRMATAMTKERTAQLRRMLQDKDPGEMEEGKD